MKEFKKNYIGELKGYKLLLFTIIISLLIVLVYIYYSNDYVIVRFNELGSLTKNMSAYYNGFRIGKVVRIGADNDFRHTLVKVKLFQKDINLPQNTTVQVKNFPNGEIYLQFVYPGSPSFKTIQRGDILEGIATYSIEDFMLGQNISGVSDLVSLHVIKALNATEIANQEMTAFFKATSKIIEGNSKGIKASVDNTAAMTKSLALMAENLNQVSKKLNNAVDEITLKDTTVNVKDMTENISIATKDMDKTMKKLDDTMTQVNEAAGNLNSITGGVTETLSKRFGGARLIFGAPLKQKKSVRNACD